MKLFGTFWNQGSSTTSRISALVNHYEFMKSHCSTVTGDVLDRSMEVASFTVKRHLGEVKFVEPSLTSPVGNFYPIEVKLTLWTTIRLGFFRVFFKSFFL